MRESEPGIAVIIPSYNRANLLPRALDSVLAQTRPPDEIIVVDDGSSDHTSGVLRQYSGSITALYQPQSGVAAARNRGVRHARSRWLAFLDSDDAWLPTKLERQLGYLQAGAAIVHSDELWVRRGRRVNPMKKHAKLGGHIFRNCLPLCIISPSAVVIDRAVLDLVGGFDESFPVCEDYELWLRITARYPVHFVSEPLIVKYGGHDDQLSRRYWGMDRFRIRALEKILATAALASEDRDAVGAMLAKKCRIYSQGARKRGREAEAQLYESRCAHYAGGLGNAS